MAAEVSMKFDFFILIIVFTYIYQVDRDFGWHYQLKTAVDAAYKAITMPTFPLQHQR